MRPSGISICVGRQRPCSRAAATEDYNRQVELFDPSKPVGQDIDLLDRELTTTQDGDYYPHMFWMPFRSCAGDGQDQLRAIARRGVFTRPDRRLDGMRGRRRHHQDRAVDVGIGG